MTRNCESVCCVVLLSQFGLCLMYLVNWTRQDNETQTEVNMCHHRDGSNVTGYCTQTVLLLSVDYVYLYDY